MEAVLLIWTDADWWATTDLHKKGKGAGLGKVQREIDKCLIEIKTERLWQLKSYTPKDWLENGSKEIVLELYKNELNTLKHNKLPVDSLLA